MPITERLDSIEDIRSWTDEIPLHYVYTAGIAGEKFLRGLKDGKILASKCDNCRTKYLPPKMYCTKCYVEIRNFVDIGKRGRISALTKSFVEQGGEKSVEPVLIGFVSFEGVDGGLIHRVLGPKPKEGALVRARFNRPANRKGSLTDIRGFDQVTLRR